jgi:hypothetical protein
VGFGAILNTGVSVRGFFELDADDWQLHRLIAMQRVTKMVFKALIFQLNIGLFGKIIRKNRKNKSNFDEQKFYA